MVSDGVISDLSLSLCRQDRKWLEDVLESQGITLSQVFLMTANTHGDFFIVRRDEKK